MNLNNRQRAGLVLVLLLALLGMALSVHSIEGGEPGEKEAETPAAPVVQAMEVPAEEVLPDKLRRLDRIEGCVVSHYCCELYPHVCGTGNGITASGAPAEPGVTCAVDPAVIPLGSTVYADYGDGVIHEYIAQDTGAWVNGGHIDLCVAGHQEALDLGVRTATVWWEEA